MVNLPQLGRQKHLQSVIMVRNINFLTDDGGEDLAGAMDCITEYNKALQLAKSKVAARPNAGDVGTMHAIGMCEHFDDVTTSAYKANEAVDEVFLRSVVVSLAGVGRCAFPQVYDHLICGTKGRLFSSAAKSLNTDMFAGGCKRKVRSLVEGLRCHCPELCIRQRRMLHFQAIQRTIERLQASDQVRRSWSSPPQRTCRESHLNYYVDCLDYDAARRHPLA